MDEYDDFRIRNRHLSENECRDRYCGQTGEDAYDLDQAIWDERNRLHDKYREIDGY